MNLNSYKIRKKQNSKFKFFSRIPIYLQIMFVTSFLSILGFIFFSIFPNLANYFFLSPKDILKGKFLWTLLTHIFFHGSFFHLFVNMFSLFFLGNITEMIIGRKRFLWFYLISGIIAGIFFVSLAFLGTTYGIENVLGDINIPGVGASGALFGLLGILAMIIPKKKVYLIAGPLILIILEFSISNFLSGNLLALIQTIFSILIFISIFSIFIPRFRKLAIEIKMPLWLAPIIAILPLILVSFFISLPIGNSAHLGGLIAGLIYGQYLRSKYPKKIDMIQRTIR